MPLCPAKCFLFLAASYFPFEAFRLKHKSAQQSWLGSPPPAGRSAETDESPLCPDGKCDAKFKDVWKLSDNYFVNVRRQFGVDLLRLLQETNFDPDKTQLAAGQSGARFWMHGGYVFKSMVKTRKIVEKGTAPCFACMSSCSPWLAGHAASGCAPFLFSTNNVTETRAFAEAYTRHVLQQSPDSLLVRIFAILQFRNKKGTPLEYWTVMSQAHEIPMNVRYDLKGNTINREVASEEKEQRDMNFRKKGDFDDAHLTQEQSAMDIELMAGDVSFLAEWSQVDYSLLYGHEVYYLNTGSTKSKAPVNGGGLCGDASQAWVRKREGIPTQNYWPYVQRYLCGREPGRGCRASMQLVGRVIHVHISCYAIIDFVRQFKVTSEGVEWMCKRGFCRNTTVQPPDKYGARFLKEISDLTLKPCRSCVEFSPREACTVEWQEGTDDGSPAAVASKAGTAPASEEQ